MKKSITLFWLYSLAAIKITFMQRFGVILFMVGKLLRFGFFFFFILQLLDKTDSLAGYSLQQTMIFFLTYSLVDTVTQIFFREVYRFRTLIIKGELDTVLIKPHHPFIKILLGGIDVLDIFMLIPYIGLFVYYSFGMNLEMMHMLGYLVLFINALLIATAFHILVLASGILTTEVDHMVMIYRDITRMGTFPVSIYGEPLRGIITYIIPIGVMMTFPPEILFGTLSAPVFFLSGIIGVVWIIGAMGIWNYAIKRYQSWGG